MSDFALTGLGPCDPLCPGALRRAVKLRTFGALIGLYPYLNAFAVARPLRRHISSQALWPYGHTFLHQPH
jgi:hypothetical protein